MQKHIRESTKKVFDGRKITGYASRETHNHAARHESSLLSIATSRVITIGKTASIKDAASLMAKNNIRRLPVVDAGTNKLVGILGVTDILDFLGGGDKHKLMEREQLAKAVNEPVRKIMEERVKSINGDMEIEVAMKFLVRTKVGGAPIVDNNEVVVGIVSERDFVRTIAGKQTGIFAKDVMTRKLILGSTGMTIEDASKAMLRNGFRRLPVVQKGKLVGIVTAMDILRALASGKVFDTSSFGLRIDRIMEKKVVTTERNRDIGDLSAIVSSRGIGAFPVLDNPGHPTYEELVGLVTERDILKAIA